MIASRIGAALLALALAATQALAANTLTLPATTTPYTANQLIANSATANLVVDPTITWSYGSASPAIPRVRLYTNDATSTAWGGQTVQVDLWSSNPTWTNGDRGAWSPATGTGGHVASFTCVMSAEYGDGAYSECTPVYGTVTVPSQVGAGPLYWSLKAVTGSGVTGASKTFTLVLEVVN